MSKTINKEIHQYLAYLKDSFGDAIYIDKKSNKIAQKTKKQILNEKKIEQPKDTLEQVLESKSNLKTQKEVTQIMKNTVNPDWKNSSQLEVLKDSISSCLNCKLGKTRNQFVFGSGNPNAEIMFIGEAPGADEDQQGLPFVGRAGKLLTKIIEAIDLTRDDVYIANIIKCRPPNNRRPLAPEVEQCEPYLKKQIELINPKFIISLGLTSIDTLLKSKHKMKDSRGKVFEYEGKKLFVTYHPAALLRNPNWKKDTWQDMKMLRIIYDQELGIKSRFSQ